MLAAITTCEQHMKGWCFFAELNLRDPVLALSYILLMKLLLGMMKAVLLKRITHQMRMLRLVVSSVYLQTFLAIISNVKLSLHL